MDQDIPLYYLITFHVLEAVPSIVLQGLIIRLYRVQVQLKTSDENTIVIMQKLSRAKYLEIFVVFMLAIDWAADFVGSYSMYLQQDWSATFVNTTLVINCLADAI